MPQTYVRTFETERVFNVVFSPDALATGVKGAYYIDPEVPGTIQLCLTADPTFKARVLANNAKDIGVTVIDSVTGIAYKWTGTVWAFPDKREFNVAIIDSLPASIPAEPGAFVIDMAVPGTIKLVIALDDLGDPVTVSKVLDNTSLCKGIIIHDSTTGATLVWSGLAWTLPNRSHFAGVFGATGYDNNLGVLSVDMTPAGEVPTIIKLCVNIDTGGTFWTVRTLANDNKDKGVLFSDSVTDKEYRWSGTDWVLEVAEPEYTVDADLGLSITT